MAYLVRQLAEVKVVRPDHPVKEKRVSTPASDGSERSLRALDNLELYSTTVGLLGGSELSVREPRSPYDVHEVVLEALPRSALTALLDNFRVLPKSGRRLEAAVGVSLRTMQRMKGDATKRLSVEQSGRTWQFAEILARATKVLGSQDAAERWLERPAIGLDRKCPIDLLATPAGARMVEDYLGRIEYGVYT